MLIGYGCGAINPYLAFETLDDMIRQGLLVNVDHKTACKNFIKAATKGVDQGRVEDRHLDDPELSRRADLRGRRAEPGSGGQVLHLDGHAHRRRGHRGHRAGSRSRATATPSPIGR